MPLILPTAEAGSRTRGELVAAVRDYGFDHLAQIRLELVVDEAVSELHNEGDWPYKEQERTGALPLVIPDLSSIDRCSLAGTTTNLEVVDRAELQDQYGDLTAPATVAPFTVYVDQGKILRSFPASERAVWARYLSTAAWESGQSVALSDADKPLLPVRYQGIIVLLAASLCYGEDSSEEAARLRELATTRIEQMRWQLLSVNRDAPRTQRTGYNAF